MANKGWSKAIADFQREAKQNIETIQRKVVERVFEEAQKPISAGGNMPVDSGDLRESLTFEGVGSGAESYKKAAATMKPNSVVTGEWDSHYAALQNYGFTHPSGKEIPGKFFADKAAAKFEEIVDEVTKEVVKK